MKIEFKRWTTVEIVVPSSARSTGPRVDDVITDSREFNLPGWSEKRECLVEVPRYQRQHANVYYCSTTAIDGEVVESLDIPSRLIDAGVGVLDANQLADKIEDQRTDGTDAEETIIYQV